jgi:hypothetical protein
LYNKSMTNSGLKMGKSSRSAWKKALLISLFIFFLTGCEAFPIEIELPWLNQTPQAPEETRVPNPDNPGVGNPPAVNPTQAGTPEAVSRVTLWLKPELDPNAGTPAGKTLQARLDLFARDNNVVVLTRVKAVGGVGGLLDSLNSTHKAAPQSLPDLVMLNREELTSASDLGLVYSTQALQESLDGSDWYPVGLNMVKVDEVSFGLPIALNPLVMAFDSQTQIPPASEWSAIVTNAGRLGFAADDPEARFMTLLYLSVGGKLEDDLQRPQLELEPLTNALMLLDEAEATKHISTLSLDFQTDQQVWESFSAWNINKAIIPINYVLAEMTVDQSKAPKPALTTPEITLADGMLWAITRNEPERQEMAQKLLEALSEPSFLAKWSTDLQQVPARASAVTLLEYPTLKPFIEKIAMAAMLYPDDAIVEKVGPVLRNAMRVVLQDGGDPAEVAAAAVESVR